MAERYTYEDQIRRFVDQVSTSPRTAYKRYGITLTYSLDPKTYFSEMTRFGWEPKTSLDFYNIGIVRSTEGDHEGALKNYEAAAEKRNPPPAVFYNLAVTYGELGDRDKQLAALRRYIEMIDQKSNRIGLSPTDKKDLEAARAKLVELGE